MSNSIIRRISLVEQNSSLLRSVSTPFRERASLRELRAKSAHQRRGAALIKRMVELARSRPRFGYRRIAALLRQEGFLARATRVLRLWRKDGLKVPRKKRKRRALGVSAAGVCERRPNSAIDVLGCSRASLPPPTARIMLICNSRATASH
jgi:transposase InsO family protein